MSPRHCVQPLLVLALAILSLQPVPGPNAVSANSVLAPEAASPSIPIYQWQFLSPAEKAAVDASLQAIRNQRIKDVTLSIVDDNGNPYTGAVQLTQAYTSFVNLAERAHVPALELWPDYTLMTPSRSYYVRAPLKDVEPSRGNWSLKDAEWDYSLALGRGMVDFHVVVSPYLGTFLDSNQQPQWAQHLDHSTLKEVLQEYVEKLATQFKGRIQYYHLWQEANTDSGNGNWPLSDIVDIVKMEAQTIRSTDPKAHICVDLMNISPEVLSVFGRGSNWTTEFFVQQLLAAAVPFDIIGIETHYGEGTRWRAGDIATLYNRLITLSKLGKAIYVFEDGLESHIDPNSITRDYWVPWHGEPSEAKQAEYMVAETLVYLGDPSVVGARWYQLQDEPWDAPEHRYQGVLTYPNASKKESFYALRNLWGNLTAHATIQSVNGVGMFMGLAGNYSISAEGYEVEPSTVQVSEGKQNTFSLVLRSTTGITSTTSGSVTANKTVPAPAPQVVENPVLILAGALDIAIVLLAAIILRRRKSSSQERTHVKAEL